jgi:hypothetical protein
VRIASESKDERCMDGSYPYATEHLRDRETSAPACAAVKTQMSLEW